MPKLSRTPKVSHDAGTISAFCEGIMTQARSYLSAISLGHLATILGVLLLAGLYVRNFWAMADLWLLARVSKHVYAGHGPVWNHIDGDRVWIFTSVAWQWLLVAAHGITGGAEPFIQAMILHSIVLIAMMAVIFWRWGMDGKKFLVVVLLMVGSNVVIDYSSGGLENGLAHLAVVAMWAMLMRNVRLRWVALVFGLSLLVRHDMAVLLGPVMAYVFWQQMRETIEPKRELIVSGVLCILPILCWSVFAWVWYGSPIPESFSAKSGAFGGSGWTYYWTALGVMDLWAVVLILAGVAFGIIQGSKERLLATGLVLYLVYISIFVASFDVQIGRLISWCVVLGILLLSEQIIRMVNNTKFTVQKVCVVITACLLLWGILPGTHTPIFPVYDYWRLDSSKLPSTTASIMGRVDARYVSITTSLPLLSRVGWDPSKTQGYRDSMSEIEQNQRQGIYTMSPEEHISIIWIASYYTPLDIVIIDNFHYHNK